MPSIYVLRLENGKYYVGKTDQVINRLEDHFTMGGCAWTRLHQPIDIVEVIPNAGPYSEDQVTKKYMGKYGPDNVRGGSYSSIILNKNSIGSEKLEFRTATDKCLRCGRDGHWARDCYARTEVVQDSSTCFNCGKSGHWASQCWARKVTCYNCGRPGHKSPDCWL